MEHCYFKWSCTLKACNFTKSNTPSWVLLRFLSCTNGNKSSNSSHIEERIFHKSSWFDQSFLIFWQLLVSSDYRSQQTFTFFKVNNRNTRKRYEICSKLTITIPERHHCHHSGVFIVNFEHISHLFLVLFIVVFEQVTVSWELTSICQSFNG